VTTLRALLYADTRSFVNQLREIRRSPGRALLWVFFSLVIAGMIVMRVIRGTHGVATLRGHNISDIRTDAVACGCLLILGIVISVGNRYAGLFAHPAEARFIIASPATPFIATLYVQMRQILIGSARQAFGLLYAALIYLPETLPAGELVRDIVLILVAFMLITATPLARQLLPPRLVPLSVTAGAILFCAAPLPVLRDAVLAFTPNSPAGSVFARFPAVHPGHILLAGAGPQFIAIAVLGLCTAALFVYVARVARDAYPELYELSMKRIARTERLRGGGFLAAARRAPVARARTESLSGSAPAGVAIFVWRAWTEYRRTNSVRSTSIETALLLAVGYIAGRLTEFGDPSRVIALVLPFVNIAFIIAFMRSATLATELRRPLFWLSGSTLFERLGALSVAQSWRIIGWCVLSGVGLVAGHAPAAIVISCVVAGPAMVLLATAIGYASYALLPFDIDQAGPLRLLRLVIGYVLLVPPLAVGIAVAILENATIAGLGVAAGTTLLEAAILIGFAAWRLDNMSISLR
jgi:hypothetical protein